MLREFQVSLLGLNDFKKLPCKSITLTKNANVVDDSVFESMFKSGQTTLLGWNVDTDLVMKGELGYQSELLVGGGEVPSYKYPLTLVSGSTSESLMLDFIEDEYLVSGEFNAYEMELANRYIDWTKEVVVEDGSENITDQVEWIDYLNCSVVIKGDYVIQDSLSITCTTVNLSPLCFANEFSVSESNDLTDTTTFDVAQKNNGHRVFSYGRTSATASLGGFNSEVDADKIKQNQSERKPVVLRFNVGSNTLKGVFFTTSLERSGDLTEILSTQHSLNVPIDFNKQPLKKPFVWNTSGDREGVDIIGIASSYRLPVNIKYKFKNGIVVEGVAYIESKEISVGVEDVSEISLSLVGSGALTITKEGV